MAKVKTSDLERLVKIFPAIGAFLIFIGFLKLYLYYGYWEINIINYLDFSEIILSFLNDLSVLFFFMLIFFLQLTVGVTTIILAERKIINGKSNVSEVILENEESSTIKSVDTSKNESIIEEVGNAVEKNIRWVLLGFLIATTVLYLLFLVFTNLVIMYIAFLVFVQFIILIVADFSKSKLSNGQIQTALAIIILVHTVSMSYYDIRKTETNPTKISLLINGNEKINSSNEYIFLGKTTNYFYFFDKVNNESWIYPSSEVKRIEQVKSD